MSQDEERAFEALAAFGRKAADRGLLASTCGNASVRIGQHYMAISASGAALESLTPAGIAVVDLRDGSTVRGGKASMEAELHRRTYVARPATGAVLHCQSRAATLLSCMEDPPSNLDLIPEIPAYVRAHAYAPYAQPGSSELAESVARALANPEVTVVQMVNHGQVVIGATWQKVVRRAVFFELACDMASSGLRLRRIPAKYAAELREYARDV